MEKKKKKGAFFSVLQKVGKSLMLPVSVLPAAGLMVAFSRMIETSLGPEKLAQMPIIAALIKLLFDGGIVVFENLPLIFAIGVAIGFTAGEAVAGLAAALGHIVLIKILDLMTKILGLSSPINMGVFSGIIIGIIAARIYMRYYKTKLHPILGFFEGKRLVPIIMVLLSTVLGIAFGFIWPPIQDGINNLGKMAINARLFGVPLGGAIYAAGNRALIPTGLHHVFKTPFTTQFGTYTNAQGQVFVGEIQRFFAGDPTAGAITAAEYPLKLFGLPAAALAMFLTAKSKNKKAIGGMMLTAALTSIITGITEPIEFAFMFVAPVLYGVHVGLAFLSGLLMNIFQVRLTETFTSSLIDYLLSIATGNAGNPIKLLPVGLVIGVLYFVAFYYLIKKFNLMTPGREEENTDSVNVSTVSNKAAAVLSALGGANNISSIDACITRLRLEVNSQNDVNKQDLKKLGSSGTFEVGERGLQVIFGTEAEILKDEIKALIANPSLYEELDKANKNIPATEKLEESKTSVNSDFNKDVELIAPVSGEVIKIENVEDKLFSDKLIGDGFAVRPDKNQPVLAPCDGTLSVLFKTNHAFSITTDDGLEVLVHIGIDTVKLDGKGFSSTLKQGDRVKKGQEIVNVDFDFVKENAPSSDVIVVITNMDMVKKLDLEEKTETKSLENLAKVTY